MDAVLHDKEFVSNNLRGYTFIDIAAAKAPHRHELLIFSDDTVLLDSFTRFIAAALKAGNAAIALVTKSHAESLRQFTVQSASRTPAVPRTWELFRDERTSVGPGHDELVLDVRSPGLSARWWRR